MNAADPTPDPRTMTAREKAQIFADRLFPDWLVRPLVAFLLVSVFIALAWGWQDQRANHVQDQQRLKDQASLAQCVSNILGQLVGSLPPVRVATEHRDAALRHVMSDLALLVRDAAEGHKASPELRDQIGADLFAYVADDNAVQAARKANPYPKTPHKLCQLDR